VVLKFTINYNLALQ